MQEVRIDKLIRSKRKTFALQITEDASLTVRAPANASIAEINRIVLKNAGWIKRKKEESLVKQKTEAKKFVSGECFLYLGKAYKLVVVSGQAVPIIFKNEFRLSERALHEAESCFIWWYKRAAIEEISARVHYYSKEVDIQYSKVKINSAQKRWGSCSSKGNLNFSWRLIMAPPSVVDYVVVHELAHIKHRNHADKFWALVKKIMPGYEIEARWLKENGYLLNV